MRFSSSNLIATKPFRGFMKDLGLPETFLWELEAILFMNSGMFGPTRFTPEDRIDWLNASWSAGLYNFRMTTTTNRHIPVTVEVKFLFLSHDLPVIPTRLYECTPGYVSRPEPLSDNECSMIQELLLALPV